MNAFERAKIGFYPLDKTLVIIDMQPSFMEDECDLVPVICRLIQYARQQKWAIIFVEFHTYASSPDEKDRTNETILEAISGYPHQETVVKTRCDGGREILDCIESKKTWSLDLLVCGVYGDQCVSDTVEGLFRNSDLVEVDVITDAVSPAYCSRFDEKVEHSQDKYGQQRESEIVVEDIW